MAIGNPTGIDNGTASADRAAQQLGKFFNHLEAFGFTQSPTTGHNHFGGGDILGPRDFRRQSSINFSRIFHFDISIFTGIVLP